MANPYSVLHDVRRTDDQWFTFGAYADLYRGEWTRRPGDTLPVAIKLIRQYTWNDETTAAHARERCLKEARLWAQLHHPNVVPFYGLVFEQDFPGLVMPYYKNGDLSHFLRSHPQANKLDLIRDAAAGLEYLHSFKPNSVVHGDIKAFNTLVTDHHRACLTDFGEANMLNTPEHEATGSRGSARWMSPELVRFVNKSATVKSDVWAFAMMILEIYSGQVPFHNLQTDAAVIVSLIKGELPPQPPEINDTVWAFLKRCWADDPTTRPTMSDVFVALNTTITQALQ